MFELIQSVKNSVYYYIKNVSCKDYIYIDTFDLVDVPGTSSFEVVTSSLQQPHPSDRGRGFCPFNTASGIFGTCEEYDVIEVYDSLTTIDPSNYSINYYNATVTASGTYEPVAIKAQWYYASVVERWPKGDIPTRPLVVAIIKKYHSKGFQLGGGKQPILNCVVEVFGSSQSELDVLTGSIYSSLYLKTIPVFDFTSGDVYTYDGFYNENFICTKDINLSVLYTEDVSVNYINFNAYDVGDLDMFRAQIKFICTGYIEA